MTAAPSCPFCSIISGEDPAARIVYRDDHVVAFLPLEPATRGHTLIAPRRHAPSIFELTPKETHDLGDAVQRIAVAIRAGLRPDGLNVIQSNGVAATQTVEHLHIHVLPRWFDDQMALTWPQTGAESGTAQDQTLAALKSALTPAAPTVTPEDRRQHLSFIQAVITRMSQASASAKTWLLPVLTLTFGFSLNSGSALGAALGSLAVLIFCLLDANYLKHERRFRALYVKVARGNDIEAFTMDPTLPASDNPNKNYWPDWQDFKSWSVAPVYGPLLAIGLGLTAYLHCN